MLEGAETKIKDKHPFEILSIENTITDLKHCKFVLIDSNVRIPLHDINNWNILEF